MCHLSSTRVIFNGIEERMERIQEIMMLTLLCGQSITDTNTNSYIHLLSLRIDHIPTPRTPPRTRRRCVGYPKAE